MANQSAPATNFPRGVNGSGLLYLEAIIPGAMTANDVLTITPPAGAMDYPAIPISVALYRAASATPRNGQAAVAWTVTDAGVIAVTVPATLAAGDKCFIVLAGDNQHS